MTQNNNSWRKTYFTLLAGQAISFISSGILGNVKEVMEIRLRSKLKSVLIVHYLKILYNVPITVDTIYFEFPHL